MSGRVTWAIKWREDGEYFSRIRPGGGSRQSYYEWTGERRKAKRFKTLESARAVVSMTTWNIGGKLVAIVRLTRRK